MRLAMSVGDNRHYLIDTVMPRHFVESAEKVGVPGSVVREQLKELADLAPRAIEGVTKSLPSRFPRNISSSIVRGVEQRLTLT
jgi:serine/threonine-protein kinase HipA